MRRGILPLACLVLAWSLAPAARADIVTLDSLAALTDASPIVVEATVTRATQRDGREFLLELEVHQTLKGSAGRHLVLAATDGGLAGMRALVFATAPKPVGTADCAGVPHRMPYVGRALTGDPEGWSLPSRDFGFHRGREAITAAVRARGRQGGVHRTVSVPVPHDAPLQAEYEGKPLGGMLLRVPADRELEHWLLAELNAEEPARRVQAIQMLEPFESVPNIERLLGLLGDDSHVVDGDGTRRYWIRHVARHVLTVWEVPLPEGPPTVVEGG